MHSADRACRLCGCTEDAPCVVEDPEDPLAPIVTCGWDEWDPRLCTFCAERQQLELIWQIRIAEMFLPARRRMVPFPTPFRDAIPRTPARPRGHVVDDVTEGLDAGQ